MAETFSETRPAYANGPQTPLYRGMQEYANQPAVQELLQKLCSDLFTEKPIDTLDYIGQWVQREKAQRELPHTTRLS